jgi:hypothetical protein
MNNTMLARLLVSITLMCSSHAFAADDLSFIQAGQPYKEVKQTLIDKGWAPIKNTKIDRSSLYAQEIYAMGMTEVTDCISMEIDGCTFVYQKGKQRLEIKTITRQLSVASFRIYKKSSLPL